MRRGTGPHSARIQEFSSGAAGMSPKHTQENKSRDGMQVPVDRGVTINQNCFEQMQTASNDEDGGRVTPQGTAKATTRSLPAHRPSPPWHEAMDAALACWRECIHAQHAIASGRGTREPINDLASRGSCTHVDLGHKPSEQSEDTGMHACVSTAAARQWLPQLSGVIIQQQVAVL